MKLTIENTSKVVNLEMQGTYCMMPARIWEGETDTGIKVHCYVTRIAIAEQELPAVHDQFAAELDECRAPSPAIAAIPSRLIL